MDPQLSQRLDQIEQKINATYSSAEKTRKYFKWTLIVTLIFLLLPLIASIFVVPLFMNAMSGLYSF